MATLTVGEKRIELQAGETVLDALLRSEIRVSFSCKQGVCQSCLVRSIDGAPEKTAQEGLKETLKARGFFLACQCRSEVDLKLALGETESVFSSATVLSHKLLSDAVVQLRLTPPENFEYQGGQFVNFSAPNGLTRCYSLASSPESDEFLELHVLRVDDGAVSGWVHERLKPRMEVAISEARGNCFYLPGDSEQTLLLVGGSTGLAPLYGVVSAALNNGHTGEIFLYHGSRTVSGLYLHNTLNELQDKVANFHYVPCVSGEEKLFNVRNGSVAELALVDHADLKGYKSFFCGNPKMVASLKKLAYLQGADLRNIYSDPFVPASSDVPLSSS